MLYHILQCKIQLLDKDLAAVEYSLRPDLASCIFTGGFLAAINFLAAWRRG